jgi:hypothetical protein
MGTWALGTKTDIEKFIAAVKHLKYEFLDSVGDDEVFDGLNSAIERAEELREFAKEELDN